MVNGIDGRNLQKTEPGTHRAALGIRATLLRLGQRNLGIRPLAGGRMRRIPDKSPIWPRTLMGALRVKFAAKTDFGQKW